MTAEPNLDTERLADTEQGAEPPLTMGMFLKKEHFEAAKLARKAALFREGTRRIYEGQGARADMWFFELWHFLGDVEKALTPSKDR